MHLTAQQDDLINFGKLIMTMCCEFFLPGHLPLQAMEHIARHYSAELAELVRYLISKPDGNKGIDEVVRRTGPRILNEIDAAQR